VKPNFLRSGALLIAATLIAGAAQAQTNPESIQAERMPLADKSLLTDIVNCANEALAVGERGHVLYSTDRKEWTQADVVPTRATLNAVTCVGDQAWAVGHDGTIIHSKDGGRNWALQRLEVMTDSDAAPQIGAPLMDVLFFDVSKGIAIGAYGLYFETSDGGATWAARDIGAPSAADADAVDDAALADDGDLADDEMSFDDEDPHYNAIARGGDGTLMIVGERGSAFQSNDNGATWASVPLDYSGSMFGVLALDTGNFLAFGLRGNAFETANDGQQWLKLDTNTDLSLMGGQALPNGGALLVGGNGVVLARRSGTETFSVSFHPSGMILSGVLAYGASEVVLTGENGISSYEPK
jgi:photosystem II stability/assembly factor-like uncharacterized protein